MFESLNAKAEKLDAAMTVIPNRLEMSKDIKELKNETCEVAKLERELKGLLEKHKEEIMEEYTAAQSVIRRTQMKMMTLLHHLEASSTCKETSPTGSPSDNIPRIVPSGQPVLAKSLNFSDTSSTSLEVSSSISEPPTTVKRKQRISFEAEVTQEMFDRVPSYMKCRTTITELQDFLQVVIKTFNQKYHLLNQKSKNLKSSDLKLYHKFKSQTFFDAEKFITDADLARVLEKKLDKKSDRFIQMMRHCHLLREARKNSVVFYIWLQDVAN